MLGTDCNYLSGNINYCFIWNELSDNIRTVWNELDYVAESTAWN